MNNPTDTPTPTDAIPLLREHTVLRSRITTCTLRCGDVVTSKDGEWPTTYANRTQAETAADRIRSAFPDAIVIHRGRPFYVRVEERAK